MKKTTYIIIGFTALLLILSFFLPVIFARPLPAA